MFASLVVSLLGLAAAPPQHLRVDLVFEGTPMRPKMESVAMEEVRGIWNSYHVDVRVAGRDGAVRSDALKLTVRLAGHQRGRDIPDALGSILFVQDDPVPEIVMYPDAIRSIVSATMMGRFTEEWEAADPVLGRAFGRALAHEIGHYLLHSRNHSVAGLMRARQPAADLVAPERMRFFLSSDEVARLSTFVLTAPVSAAVSGAPFSAGR
jgi:hypothetical protein